MSTKAELTRVVEEAICELHLDCRVMDVSEVADAAYMWRIVLLNHAAPKGQRPVDVCVEWTDAPEIVKADLKVRLSAACLLEDE